MVHAVHKTLQGDRSLCDGSRVVAWLSGRFDSDGPDACHTCAALTSVTG
jgi:hypothetical protein